MGLEKVIGEIISSGEEQSRKIAAEADREKREIIGAARTEAEALGKELEAEAKKRIGLMRQQALSSAVLEAKKRVLQEQNMLLTKLLEDALKQLSSKDKNELKPLLDKLSKAAAKRLSKGVIHCRKEDVNLFLPPLGFKNVGDLSASGGIIAESEDGAFRIDLTFEALLDEIWGKKVRNIYDLLFGGA